MPLSRLLLENKPRESSGSRSSNRFDFQRSWGLCHLIELHESGGDYVIVFEFHDDIMVLDCSKNPSRADFHQIKTRSSGAWSKADLLRRKVTKDGTGLSILGKLTDHLLRFPGHVGDLTVVSNQAFKLVLGDGKKAETQAICLDALAADERHSIVDALRTEHGSTVDCAHCTRLVTTPLSLEEHTSHALGVFTNYLIKTYPQQKLAIEAAFRALSDEIKRKSTSERVPSTFEELKAQRGITRADFDEILSDVASDRDIALVIQRISARLNHEGMDLMKENAIVRGISAYEIDRMDRSNLMLQRIRSAVARQAEQVNQAAAPLPLMDHVRNIQDAVREISRDLVNIKGEPYLHGAIILALYGYS